MSKDIQTKKLPMVTFGEIFIIWFQGFTCTMAMCSRTPRSPTANEAAAMTAGPVRNLTLMAKAATEFPQAIILGCNAMNKPTIQCDGFI